VQNQLGIMEKMDGFRKRMSETQFNALSVRLELQADCFAGVWAHHAQNRKLLEAGDVEEAMRAAAAIGDDTIQRRTQGAIVPESFTHGTSEQRMRWFDRHEKRPDLGLQYVRQPGLTQRHRIRRTRATCWPARRLRSG
jgi:predicted metalloprotease